MDAAHSPMKRNTAIPIPSPVLKMKRKLGYEVKDAYLLAAEVHAGQTRESGEDYITHPIAVAALLFSIGADG